MNRFSRSFLYLAILPLPWLSTLPAQQSKAPTTTILSVRSSAIHPLRTVFFDLEKSEIVRKATIGAGAPNATTRDYEATQVRLVPNKIDNIAKNIANWAGDLAGQGHYNDSARNGLPRRVSKTALEENGFFEPQKRPVFPPDSSYDSAASHGQNKWNDTGNLKNIHGPASSYQAEKNNARAAPKPLQRAPYEAPSSVSNEGPRTPTSSNVASATNSVPTITMPVSSSNEVNFAIAEPTEDEGKIISRSPRALPEGSAAPQIASITNIPVNAEAVAPMPARKSATATLEETPMMDSSLQETMVPRLVSKAPAPSSLITQEEKPVQQKAVAPQIVMPQKTLAPTAPKESEKTSKESSFFGNVGNVFSGWFGEEKPSAPSLPQSPSMHAPQQPIPIIHASHAGTPAYGNQPMNYGATYGSASTVSVVTPSTTTAEAHTTLPPSSYYALSSGDE